MVVENVSFYHPEMRSAQSGNGVEMSSFGSFQSLFLHVLPAESGRLRAAGVRLKAGQTEDVHPAVSPSVGPHQKDAVSLDHRQLFDLDRLVENHPTCSAL